MRQSPTESEYAAAPTMSDVERLEYFMTRVFETDEVWFLKQPPVTFRREVEGQTVTPLWPYRRFATDAALDQWQDCVPSSVSLEHFLYHVAPEQIAAGDAMVEIMPRGEAPGCLIALSRLCSILEGMIDAGEYRMDG